MPKLTSAVLIAIALLVPAQFGRAAASDTAANLDACQDFSQANPVSKTFNYVLNGQKSQLETTLYPGLVQCLEKLKTKTRCPGCVHAVKEDQNDADMVNNQAQNQNLQDLVSKIQQITPDKNDQARIAISLVQGLPYEDNDQHTYDFPYEVALDQTGICNETAKLIILLLKDLGFGTAMLTFEQDNHQAAGIKCNPQYSYQNTGYCFVEATTRAIVTDPVGENTQVRVNKISDGDTFDASKDYQDAQSFLSLFGKKKLSDTEKTTLKNLEQDYGIGKNS